MILASLNAVLRTTMHQHNTLMQDIAFGFRKGQIWHLLASTTDSESTHSILVSSLIFEGNSVILRLEQLTY